MALGLESNRLVFEFPEVHEDAVLHVTFQRTLRVPDDGKRHHLPPGFGPFPLRAIDDLEEARLPPDWKRRGGVALPMWQAEACWIHFASPRGYPMAVKVAAGKINAVNGKEWTNTLDLTDQDYCEVPGQPWLDGFCVEKGVVRQFVAMPLGQGYTAEEQITGRAEHGGMQFLVHPLKAGVWQPRKEERERLAREAAERAGRMRMYRRARGDADVMYSVAAAPMADMGLAPGGSIEQVINKATERAEDWDLATRSRCFVHIANSLHWRAVTGDAPPTVPPTAKDYARAGLPWFAWYDDAEPVQGSAILARLKSVFAMGRQKGEAPLPENESFEPPEPVRLGPKAERGVRSEF